ncbi:(2Fe-2S) ferredoxin domain-containing protein [bacterium]|nr:(2Fe-2S) ferredoxin domain-containing protein [bacterium]
MNAQTKPITVCMGSSCYARGNANNVELIQTWLRIHGMGDSVELGGTLCEGRCCEGPVVRIGQTVYTKVAPASVGDILEHEFPEAAHG